MDTTATAEVHVGQHVQGCTTCDAYAHGFAVDHPQLVTAALERVGAEFDSDTAVDGSERFYFWTLELDGGLEVFACAYSTGPSVTSLLDATVRRHGVPTSPTQSRLSQPTPMQVVAEFHRLHGIAAAR